MQIDIKDNSNEILSAFESQFRLGLELIGTTAEGYAKDNCPVDTGRLRNSISHEIDDNSAYIGTNVEYAEYVEFRDSKHTTGNAHFLRDAASTHSDEYKTIMESALKS